MSRFTPEPFADFTRSDPAEFCTNTFMVAPTSRFFPPLGRMPEMELRKYIRGILEKCSPGRFALGSGNTIANYIPVENYLVMLQELRTWNEESGLTG